VVNNAVEKGLEQLHILV